MTTNQRPSAADAARAKMTALLTSQTTAKLVEAFCLTERLDMRSMSSDDAAAVFLTRGKLMDELERRDAEAFATWIDGRADEGALRAAYGVTA